MEKNKKKTLLITVCSLAAVLVCAIYVLSFLFREMNSLLVEDSFPTSTLSDEETVFSTKALDESVYVTCLECPSFPYSLLLPWETYSVNGDAVVASLEEPELSFLLQESSADMRTFISGCVAHLNLTAIGTPDVSLKESVTDTGYINGFAAEYWAGTLTVKASLQTFDLYAVCYRLESDETTLYLSAFSRTVSDMPVAKAYLDDIIFGLEPKGVPVVETPDVSVEDNVSGEPAVAGDKTTVYDENYASYMETTSTSIPVLPVSFSVELESPMENGVFVFQWLNADTYPLQLTVTNPDGEVFYYNYEESYGGMYSFSLGECPAGRYLLEGTTAVTLEGCWFFICDDAYYRSEVLYEVE